jgi:hypothetical protein
MMTGIFDIQMYVSHTFNGNNSFLNRERTRKGPVRSVFSRVGFSGEMAMKRLQRAVKGKIIAIHAVIFDLSKSPFYPGNMERVIYWHSF